MLIAAYCVGAILALLLVGMVCLLVIGLVTRVVAANWRGGMEYDASHEALVTAWQALVGRTVAVSVRTAPMDYHLGRLISVDAHHIRLDVSNPARVVTLLTRPAQVHTFMEFPQEQPVATDPLTQFLAQQQGGGHVAH